MRLLFLILSVFVLRVDLAAEETNRDPLRFGMLLPLSGSYAAGGVDNRQGIEAALALSPGIDGFELHYADTKADATTGISEFRKMIAADGIIAAFVMRGSVGMAANSVSRAAGVPLLGAVGNKDFAAVNPYAFQIWTKSDEEGAFLAALFKEKKYNKIALLTVQDDWQDAVSAGFREALNASGVSPVFDEEAGPDIQDFRAQLLRIKSSRADVIFANLGLAQIGPFLRQAQETGNRVPVYANFWAAKKEVVDAAGAGVLEGVRFVEMDTAYPALTQFIKKTYGTTVSGGTLAAYTAVLLLRQTLQENRNIKTPEDLYQALLKQTEVRTPDAAIPLRDRCVKFPLAEKVMRGGKAEKVSGGF